MVALEKIFSAFLSGCKENASASTAHTHTHTHTIHRASVY